MQATDVVIAVCFLHIAGSLANQPPLYPRLSEEPESFVLSRSGVNVTLKCRSSAGRIRPTWFHNGKLIHESDVYMLLDTGDLFIKEFEPGTQEGRYYCEVSVPDGGTVRSRTAVLQRKVVKPELLIPPTNLTVYEGNPAYFYCTPETNVDLEQLEGNRFPGCTNGGRWNKDKCPLNESEEMLFPPDNSLFIKNATLSHPVEFCCNVKMPKCAYLNTVPSRGLTHTPTIALQPKTKTVETGETVVIPCIVKSVPRSEIDWLKPNGKQVKRKSQHRVSVLSDNMLVIKNALTRDSGVYHCKASNTVGQVTMNVTIIVIAVPKVNHTFNDTLRNQTPGPVKIVCPIIEPHYRKSVKKTNATPSFQTVWLKDGTEIKESDSIDILQPSNDTLYIKDAQIMDSGMYQCIVENIYGSNVQTTFRLDVINPSAQGPSRVRDLKLTYIPGNFQLSWSSPEHLGCRTRQCTIQNYSIKILPTFGSDLKGSDDVVGRVTSVYLYSKSRPYLYGSGEYNFEVTAQNSDNFWGQPGRTSSKVLELPKEHDIDIVETTSTSVRITYRLPKDDIASSSCKFCVHYNPTDKYQRSSQCLDPCLGDGPFPEYAKALQTMEIKALKSNTTYRFYAEVTYSTRKALSYWISCTTGLEAPSETPRLLQVVRINSTAFIIDFMGIHNSGLRNLSFYYQLNYFNGTEPIPIVKFHPQNMAETANGTIRIVIDGSALGLAAWMDYELSMQSCCNSNNCKEWAKQSKCGRRTNSEMPGVFADFKKFCLFSCNCSRQHSQRVIIRPHDIDFEPVDDVQVTDISTESAHIAWQPVNSSLQLVYGYRVNVKSDDPMKPSIVKNTTLSHLSVTGLQAYTDYSVTVSVLTFDRQKAVAQSKPLRFQTEIDVYAAPHNVTIERGHQLNSAVISWKFFSSDQATVFNVSCCETQKCISPQYSATSNNITIDGLLPHEEYAFRVSRIIGNRQGKWSKCVSYTTPNFRPPPEIRGYCVESDGIHLTCFVSNCPDKCQPLLNVSICWSNQAHCIYSLFDRNNSTVKEHTNGTRTTVHVSWSGLISNLSWGSPSDIAVRYVNFEGDTIPAVWSERIPLPDNSSVSSYEQTTCSDSGKGHGWSWMVTAVSSLSTVVLLFVIVGIVIFLLIRKRRCKWATGRFRPDRLSTVSSVGPRHKESHTYESTIARTNVENDDSDYEDLAAEAKRTHESHRNRVTNQGDISLEPRVGLYLSTHQPEEAYDSRESLRGHLNFQRKNGEEEGKFKEDIPLSELRQSTQCVISSDESESEPDTSMDIASSNKRRNGVIVQPHIEILPQFSPNDLSYEDGYGSNVSICSDEACGKQNQTSTTYVELRQLMRQEKQKESLRDVSDSKDKDVEFQEEPCSNSFQLPQAESSYVQLTQSSLSPSIEHLHPVSRTSSQFSSQENIHDLFQGIGDDNISTCDEDFNKGPRPVSMDYVSKSSNGETSEYVQLPSCTHPQQQSPQEIDHRCSDYV